ncbi:MAG TPA: sialidase family protein, partial [Acidimicrobiales bacterium]
MRGPTPRVTRTLAVLAGLSSASLGSLGPAYAAPPHGAATPVDVSGGSDPFASCTADDVDAQEATFGSTLYPGAEVEPRLAVDPTNPLNLAGLFQQDRWSDGAARGLVAAISHDGGKTWKRVVLPGVSKCSGGPANRATDPWISFGPNGTLYASAQTADAPFSPGGVTVSRSTNGGDSWEAPVTLIDDTYIASFNDKESVTADPQNANIAYVVWDRFISPPSGTAADQGAFRARSFRQETWFSRTTNGGVSWEPARAIYNQATQGGTFGNIITVLPNGDLVDGFILFAVHRQKLLANIALIRSHDKGATWSNVATLIAPLDLSFFGAYDPDNGNPIRTGGAPDFAVDPVSGKLYAVWEDDTQGSGVDAIQFSQSGDGGMTWSPPVKINQTPSTVPAPDQQAFTATVRVAADGTVGVTYYDLRQNTPTPGLPTNYWLARCHISCTNSASWVETHVAGPFDEEQAAFAGGYFVGDYEGMVTNGTTFEPLFAQAVSQA